MDAKGCNRLPLLVADVPVRRRIDGWVTMKDVSRPTSQQSPDIALAYSEMSINGTGKTVMTECVL